MTAFIAGLFYKAFGMMIGGGFGVMGYMLLCRGIFDQSDLSVVWGNRKLLLKRAAPGTLFALFGAAIIIFMIWKNLTVTDGGTFMATASYENAMHMVPIPTKPSPPPADILGRRIEAADITPADEVALLKWYAANADANYPDDIDVLLRAIILDGTKLSETMQLKLKQWLANPHSFEPRSKPKLPLEQSNPSSPPNR